MTAAPLPFDRIADRYDATRGGPERGRQLAEAVGRCIVPGPVLEVGVGTGLVAAALAGRGDPVFGVDLAPAMLHRAAGRLGTGRVAVGDARALPVADAAVPNVLLVAVLHVVGDLPAALREAGRAIRPGGRVVTVTGATGTPAGDLATATAGLPRHRPDTDEAVAAAARAAGLTELHVEPVRVGPLSQTPNELADNLEHRAWSYLWTLDEAAWRDTVEPAIARLRALPDPDRPRQRALRFRLAAYTR